MKIDALSEKLFPEEDPDGDIVDAAFDGLSEAQEDGTLGVAAGIAANVAAPGTGGIA